MTTAIRKKNNLYLSAGDVRHVRAKFPKAPDEEIYIDAVFEGGGVRGLAFLGALRCLSDAGINVRKVAGTSAGAMTAAIVASGMPLNSIEASVMCLDFMELLKAKTSRFIMNGDPSNDMNNMGMILANLTLVGARGQYKTDALFDWMNGVLEGRLETFGDVGTGDEWHLKRDLQIVISDISAGEMRVLPSDLKLYDLAPEKFSVAEAVRLSMSIPLFFEPGTLGGNTIVDGGILSSFPLATFDTPQGVTPCCPTLGFKLSPGEEEPKKVTSAIGVFSAMVNTMMVAHDRRYSRLHDRHRIVNLTSTDVSITKFSMTAADKENLYVRGYNETKSFLLNEWSWDEYLKDRI